MKTRSPVGVLFDKPLLLEPKATRVLSAGTVIADARWTQGTGAKNTGTGMQKRTGNGALTHLLCIALERR
jgi:hypothetical protein